MVSEISYVSLCVHLFLTRLIMLLFGWGCLYCISMYLVPTIFYFDFYLFATLAKAFGSGFFLYVCLSGLTTHGLVPFRLSSQRWVSAFGVSQHLNSWVVWTRCHLIGRLRGLVLVECPSTLTPGFWTRCH